MSDISTCYDSGFCENSLSVGDLQTVLLWQIAAKQISVINLCSDAGTASTNKLHLSGNQNTRI